MSKYPDYDVFISYRHRTEDKTAAENLQKLLEKLKIKDSSGKMRYLKVFRDQSEFHTGTDLERDIQTALERSQYLVTICSPYYLESEWCMKELNYFRLLHNNTNQNILPLLVSGDPEVSFPPILRIKTREINGRMIEEKAEPLAANICAENTSQMLKKLKSTEYLRIAAPILKVTFDELYQRKQLEQRKRVLWGAAVVSILSLAFGIYNYYMMTRISREHQQTLIEESENLAYMSKFEYEQGDRAAALWDALQALPTDGENRPVVPEAKSALSEALNLYKDEKIRPACIIREDSEIIRYTASDDGKYIFTQDLMCFLNCYDGRTGERLWKVKKQSDHFAQKLYVIDSQNVLLEVGFEEQWIYSIDTGACIGMLESPNSCLDMLEEDSQTVLDIKAYAVSSNEDTLAILLYNRSNNARFFYLALYDLNTMELISVTKHENKLLSSPQNYNDWKLSFSDDKKYIAMIYYRKNYCLDLDKLEENELIASLLVMDLEDGRMVYEKTFPHFHEIELCFLENNDLLYTYRDFTKNEIGITRYSLDAKHELYTTTFGELTQTKNYALLPGEETCIYLAAEEEVLIDTPTGTIKERNIFEKPRNLFFPIDKKKKVYITVTDSGDTSIVTSFDKNTVYRGKMREKEDMYSPYREAEGYDCFTMFNLGFYPYSGLGNFEIQPYLLFLSYGQKNELYTYQIDGDTKGIKIEENLEHAECKLLHSYNQGQFLLFEKTFDDTRSLMVYDTFKKTTIFTMELPISLRRERLSGLLEVYYEYPPFSILDVSEDEKIFFIKYLGAVNAETNEVCTEHELIQKYTELKDKNDNELKRKINLNEVIKDLSWLEEYLGVNGYEFSDLESLGGRIFSSLHLSKEKPLFLFTGQDGYIRILDRNTGKKVSQYAAPIDVQEIASIDFIWHDQYIMIQHSSGTFYILDTYTGKIYFEKNMSEYLLSIIDYSEEDVIQELGTRERWTYGEVYEDFTNNRLFINDNNVKHRYNYGVCIEIPSFSILHYIEGFRAYIPETNEILRKSLKADIYMIHPVYELNDMIQMSREQLNADIPGQS